MELDRRSALLGLAAAGAVLPLVVTQAAAQTRPASSVAGPDNYVQQTLLLGTVAMKTSEIALEKASDPNVRKFAELEIAEQKTSASVLAATPSGTTPPELPPERQEKIDALSGMEAGPDFDQAYVQAQIEGHNELLQTQQMHSGEREATVEAVTARLAEQAVASRLVMLNLIQQLSGAEYIENIQEGKNPDGSTAPAGETGDSNDQAPAEKAEPAATGG